VRETTQPLATDAESYDLVYVVAPQNRGWILEGICKEIDRRFDGRSAFHYGLRPLPPSRAYFFSHYSLFLECLGDPALRRATSVVWFTHPSWDSGQTKAVVRGLRKSSTVVSSSSTQAEVLSDAGFPRRKLTVVLPGADPEVFRPHRRGNGAVGLCSAYYPRKAPGVVHELLNALPHRAFLLLGRGWPDAPEFSALQATPNFTYVERDYGDYPAFYDSIDVFVSPSRLEGGPIPLLEAMMANAVPVATRTGFAPDVISHGGNGFLCAVDAPVDTLAELVEAAFALDADVRSSVEHLTWERFAREVLALTHGRTAWWPRLARSRS
jgi:glycosyltransferase involved in cell wall biosynthesis